jgi:hypothetical protein
MANAIKYLGEDELIYLITQLKEKLDPSKIINTDTPDASSTDTDVPSSKAVHAAATAATPSIQIVTGTMSAVTPAPNTYYLHHDDANDATYDLYFYVNSAWYSIAGGGGSSSGDTFTAITEDEIDDILDDIFGSSSSGSGSETGGQPAASEPA